MGAKSPRRDSAVNTLAKRLYEAMVSLDPRPEDKSWRSLGDSGREFYRQAY